MLLNEFLKGHRKVETLEANVALSRETSVLLGVLPKCPTILAHMCACAGSGSSLATFVFLLSASI